MNCLFFSVPTAVASSSLNERNHKHSVSILLEHKNMVFVN